MEWNLTGTGSEDYASIKLSARNIGSVGMIVSSREGGCLVLRGRNARL